MSTEPARAVFVGDRPFDDIHGAKEVGMRAVLVPHSAIPEAQRGHVEGDPDAVVQRLGDLLAIIDAWNAGRTTLSRADAVPELSDVLLLCLAAGFAGWIDAISGGGGLVQLPALLVVLPGASPIQVLATNKLASICGTSASAATYYRKVRPDLRTALPMAGIALVGAALGALCISLIPSEVFRPLVLVLLVAVAAYTVFRPGLGDVQSLRWDGRQHHVAAGLGGFGLGFYDGIFGAGHRQLPGLPARRHARLLVPAGLGQGAHRQPGRPTWARCSCSSRRARRCGRLGLAMGACNMAGAWLGAHTAIRRGSAFVRVVFLTVVAALILKLGYDVVRS